MSDFAGPPILFLDLDGTIRHGKAELGRFVNNLTDVHAFPEAVVAISRWQAGGGVAVGVTNQGGVGLGYIDPESHHDMMTETVAQTGLDNVIACPHRPDARCWCRKPQPGLMFGALEWVGAQYGALPHRDECLMVGDRDEDEEAARRAGIPFLRADQWRARTP